MTRPHLRATARSLAAGLLPIAVTLAFLTGVAATSASESVVAAGGPPWAWRTEPVVPYADAGAYTSIALDSSGAPYISFVDGANGTLEVAHRDGGAWVLERVAGPSTFTGDTSIAFAPDGTLRLAFYDETAKQVKYAARGPSGWNVSVVDGGSNAGFNRLAFDAKGNPALAYVSYNGWLRYAAWNGTAWVRETVDNVSILSRYVDLTFDGLGRPYVCYYADGLLRYAVKVGSTWIREVVDSSLYSGWFARIRLDRAGVPHIAYFDSVNKTLRWATRLNGTWTHTILDGSAGSGWDLGLSADRLGRFQISYYTSATGFLRYAINTTTGWVLETVDVDGVVGWYTSLAADASGLPHISYYDWTNGRLKIAEGYVALQTRTIAAATGTGGSVTLSGELVALGNHSSAQVGFLVLEPTSSSWTYLPAANVTSAGTFRASLGNVSKGVTYEFRAQAVSGNETSLGTVQSFSVAVPARPNPFVPIAYVALGIAAVAVVLLVVFLWLRREKPKVRR